MSNLEDAAIEAGLKALAIAKHNLRDHLDRFKPEDLELLRRVAIRASKQAAADALMGGKDEQAWLQLDSQLKSLEVAVAIPVKGLVTRTLLDAIGQAFEEGWNFIKPLLGELAKKATE
ncbi:MAG: hypothetical protein ICCCNLDF_02806 [Planctomycetes bacterium]|nr:hypothetical protein [Planctomycetota bacterium]